jgi:hypothetical protein
MTPSVSPKPSILRQHREQVLGDIGEWLLLWTRTLDFGENGLQSFITFLEGQRGVMDNSRNVWVPFDGGGNRGELGVDFDEGLW